MLQVASVLTIFSFFQIVISGELPSDFKRCNSKDSKCLKSAIQNALPKLAGGIKELGVPPLDPIKVPKMSVKAGKIVQLVQNYDNIEFSGMCESTMNDVSIDLEKGKMKFDFDTPRADFNGSYIVRGKILILDVYGQGKCSISQRNVKAKLFMDVQKYEKNGDKYLKVTKSVLELEPEHVYYNFDNLFDGNKQLGDNINNVLNDNWKEIFLELKDDYVKAIARFLMKFTNKLFDGIPMKNIFLD